MSSGRGKVNNKKPVVFNDELYAAMDKLVLEDGISMNQTSKMLGCSYSVVQSRYAEKIPAVPKPCTNPDCHRAGEILPLTEFYLNKQTKDGYSHYCKICANYKRDESMDSGEGDCMWRDPIEMARFSCTFCGMWADMETGWAFVSQDEADQCCSIEKRGDAVRLYECPVHKGMKSIYARPNSSKINLKYTAHRGRTWLK